MVLYSYDIYVLLSSYLRCCVLSINTYNIAIFHHGLPTLAVPYDKILPILVAFDFKELQIICKSRYMKCFQTVFSSNSSFFLPNVNASLARLDLMFTYRKTYYFMLNFQAYLPVPKLNLLYIITYRAICLSAYWFLT